MRLNTYLNIKLGGIFLFCLIHCVSFAQKSALIYKTNFDQNVDKYKFLRKINGTGGINSHNLSLQYSFGTDKDRFAKVVPDPINPNNYVLKFNISSVGLEERQRVQASFSSVPAIKEIKQCVRILFSSDMAVLGQYESPLNWLILAEWWNSAPRGWNTPGVFRVSLRVVKDSGKNKHLFFKVDAQSVTYSKQRPRIGTGAIFKTEWEKTNNKFEIPYNKWLTFEYHIKSGDRDSGLFYMAVTPDGGQKQVIFDLKCVTQSLEFESPRSFNFWSPMKLYSSKDIVHFMVQQNKALAVYFDNLKIVKLNDK